MDEQIINQLFRIIYQRWNDVLDKDESKKKINSLLHRKKTSKVIAEYSYFLKNLAKEKKKNPLMTLILVLALCRRNLEDEEVIYDSLKDHQLIHSLFNGISILVKGKSKKISIELEWGDKSFENKYEFINRFQGEFRYWEYIELFIAVKIIQRDKQNYFEELVLQDETHLLLLNLTSGRFDGRVSDKFIISLINHENELKQNAGFYILMFTLKNCIQKDKSYQNRHELEEAKSHREFLENKIYMKKEITWVNNILSNCQDDIKCSLIINYLLVEPETFLIVFAELLLDYNHKNKVINEIRNTKKINTLDKVYYLLSVVSCTKLRNKPKNYTKLELYNELIDIVIFFVKERKGIDQWTNKEHETMQKICVLLPKKSKYRLLRFLNKESENLLCSTLDELVRFDIFLKDKNRQSIITGMIDVLKQNLDDYPD